jgi:myosin-crossreactive antigen
MSIVLAYQPHFIERPADVQVFWVYAFDRYIPRVTPHHKSLRVEFEALVKAFK